MVHRDRSLVTAGGAAAPADVAVPLENPFPQAAEVSRVLPPERVAGRAVAVRHDILAATSAVKRALNALLHDLSLGQPNSDRANDQQARNAKRKN